METIYLGLGSNLGERRGQLRAALVALTRCGVVTTRVAPVIETEALLLPGSPPSWKVPFLNTVLEARTRLSPVELLSAIKRIEQALGREPGLPRWAPRPIDIDILFYGCERIDTPELTVPHPEIGVRDFVLTPLLQLAPGKPLLPGGQTVRQAWLDLPEHTPLWMGVVNVTPDSFSGDGKLPGPDALQETMATLFARSVNYVDIGAESTRPGGVGIDVDEELARLEPALTVFKELRGSDPLAPKLSIDTRNAKVAEAGLAAGAELINDVSGIGEDAMVQLAKGSEADFVAMHHTALPADPSDRIPPEADPVAVVRDWFNTRQSLWEAKGLDHDRIILDPGIGFGKAPAQSWQLLRNIPALADLGHRILIGHSRKGFLNAFTGMASATRDPETIAVSLGLLDQGASIIRVHDVDGHQRAYKSWRRLRRPPSL